MKNLVFLITCFLILFVSKINGSEQLELPKNKLVVFLDAKEAIQYLSKNEYYKKYSNLDISLRLEKDLSGENIEDCKSEYFSFIKSQIKNWKRSQIKYTSKIIKEAYSKIEDVLPSSLPDTLYLINSTGKQEFGAFYTVGNAIICPNIISSGSTLSFLGYVKAFIEEVFIHEIFHIYSTNNPDIRHKLYSAIGFYKMNEFELSDSLSKRLITNPDDKPGNYYFQEKNEKYSLLILSKYDKWEGYVEFAGRVSALLVYLDSKLVPVEINHGVWYNSHDKNKAPIFIDKTTYTPFINKYGKHDNTISPEEICASLFVDVIKSKYNPSILKENSSEYNTLIKTVQKVFVKN